MTFIFVEVPICYTIKWVALMVTDTLGAILTSLLVYMSTLNVRGGVFYKNISFLVAKVKFHISLRNGFV